jgi:hypothetical protein
LKLILNEEKIHGIMQQPEFNHDSIELKSVLKFSGLMGAPGAIIKAGKRTVRIRV